MIIKKLLVPFINEKILLNAEHCYIASAAISETAFDFLMSKLPPKCKIDIVTGLDFPTEPGVLSKALRQYPNRINFRVHLKNTFHSNVYIFDLPFRKMVAFVGSANLTMGGIKDQEELSYKIDTEKGVEEMKVWFRSYFEYADELSEVMLAEYEEIYPSMLERNAESKRDKTDLIEATNGTFNWITANLKDQYFQEEEYRTFENHKAILSTKLVQFQREQVQTKLLELHDQLKPIIKNLKLHVTSSQLVIGMEPIQHLEHKVKGLWLSYGRGEKELEMSDKRQSDLMCFQVLISRNKMEIFLLPGKPNKGKVDREHFRNEMQNEAFRKKFFEHIKVLSEDYWLDIAGEKQQVSFFKTADQLGDFTNKDSLHFHFKIGRTYLPNHSDLASSAILSTVQRDFTKLLALYTLMKADLLNV